MIFMKKKVILSGIITLFFISILIPAAHSAILDIWNVHQGDYRFYFFSEVYTGNLTGTNQYPTLKYHILNNGNFDGNNKSDIHFRVNSLECMNPIDNLVTFYDNNYFIYAMAAIEYQLFTFLDFDQLDIIHIQAQGGNFIIPIKGNNTWSFFPIVIFPWGVNWSRVYTQINLLLEYNCTYIDNELIINCTKINEIDANIDLKYNLTKTIIWNNSTGFLTSFKMEREYEDNFGKLTSQITSQSTYSQQQTPIIFEVSDTFWFIALIICGIAATTSIIIFYKYSKKWE